MDRKIDVTAILFVLVQNRQQTHDWTLIVQALMDLACKCEKIIFPFADSTE